MNNEKIYEETIGQEKEKLVSWDDVNVGSYIKLERDKAKVLLLVNWKVREISKFTDDKTGLPKKQIEFVADVLNEDGTPCQKIFTTTSVNALKGLKEIFAFKKNDKALKIRIKKIGEGVKTVYDIEEQAI